MTFNSVDMSTSALCKEFTARSKSWNIDVDSEDFARKLDREDPLSKFRERFYYPKKKYIIGEAVTSSSSDEEEDDECIYFCGHSLGLQLKSTENNVQRALKNWARRAVESHFHGEFPAALCDSMLKEKMAHLVGAEEREVAVMNGLTVNIHVLLSTFYNPNPQRYKILMLEHGFHSDLYAVQSQVRFRGYDPKDTIVFFKPKEGTQIIDPEDILSFLEKEGENFALIFFEGVHFYTGQLFDMKNITRVGHKKGCVVGFDLAHAIGNTELHIHEWNVDFAMWCTYKYLNSGPGSLGAIFVHSRHTSKDTNIQPMMAGWWGIDDKFSLSRVFHAAEGADRFKISNSSPFLVAMISASLDVFIEAGMERLLEKQRLLTGYLEYLLKKNFCEVKSEDSNKGKLKAPLIDIITPNNSNMRGSQISFMSLVPILELEGILKLKGILCDIRKPSVIRVTPVPLYNTFTEVYKFVHILKDIFDNLPIGGVKGKQ